MTFLQILLVGIGGFLGAVARYSISLQLSSRSSFKIPMGTLTVNLVGAFLLGIITGVHVNRITFLIFGIGFLGAFTTFSTLKLEMTRLHKNEKKKTFFLYTMITYGCGLLLAYIGYWVGHLLSY
ncbi:CrcB protein [Oikeobacillus pervagus]|uniref:Fluoride-specific ion channel FluC n=1 Tax=Oikeobacillus pervagus TaxID=1325931 RepID=A0AAJ1WFJ1_9BACI|nr:fluoride efflux transporter CrcB [Oikeobacillus pervagus]MDQ0214007.1 CrcB protein [Oikeobacillus pervagus]